MATKIKSGVIGTLDSNLVFADNSKAIFGAGSDLQIHHDGTHSYLLESNGTGNLYLGGDNLFLTNANITKVYVKGIDGGATELRHNNLAKLATTSTGIDVTGTATATSLSAGSATFEGAAVNINILETNTTDVNTRLRLNSGDFIIQTLNDAQNAVTSRLAVDNATGDISFYEDTGSTAKFFWDASAESLGIGTTSPDFTLDIEADKDTWISRIYNTGSDASAQALLVRSDATAAHDATVMGVYTDGGYKMVVRSTGRVGIGQTNPKGSLEIYNNSTTTDGDGTATMTMSGQDSIILYGHGGVNNKNYGSIAWTDGNARRRAMITSAAENADNDFLGLAFYTQGADGAGDINESMRIAHSGKVGINNSNPTAKLTVTDEDAGQAMVHVRNYSTGATGSFGNAHSAEFRSATSTTTHGMLIHHNENNIDRRTLDVADSTGVFASFVQGKLGIGTDTPSSKLQIMGGTSGLDQISLSSNLSDNTVKYAGLVMTMYTNNTAALIGAKAENGNTSLFYGSSGSDHRGVTKHIWYTNSNYNSTSGNTESMRIGSSGNVTKPTQCNFLARRSGSQTGYNASGTYGDGVRYNSEIYDIGGDFDVTTGIFTAPVDGTYLIQGSVYTNTSGVSWSQAWLAINGARANYTDMMGNDGDLFISTTHVVKLSAGDEVRYHPYYSGSTSVTILANNNHTWFKGYLLG